METFKHSDPDAFHGKQLTLHDCTATKICLQNNVLHFYFPEGFWVTTHHRANTSGNVVRTDASAVTFSIEDPDDIMIRVFTRRRWLGSRNTRVEFWDLNQLISKVNSGKCTIEFITQYRSHYEQLWHCAIHSHKKPYYAECHLHLPNTSATFYWNDLRPDHQW